MRRNWLIEIRKKKRLTQENVASLCFIDRGYYAQIELGTRQPSILIARKIASALSFNPTIFFIEDLNNPFHSALKDSPVTIAQYDLELRYTWIFNLSLANTEDLIGKRDDQIEEHEGTLNLMDLKREVLETGLNVRRNITYPESAGGLTYDVFGRPIREKDKFIGGSTVSTEVTHLVKRY